MAERKYIWEDQITGKIVQIYRPIDLYDLRPDVNEAQEQGMTTAEYDKAKWERIIQAPFQTIKWPATTGPVKGRP